MKPVLRETLERLTRETGLVGGVTALFRDDRVFFTDCYGYADRESGRPATMTSSFDIASCSKAWTVMLAAQAVDEGLISWDDPIQRVMPEFTLTDPYARRTPVHPRLKFAPAVACPVTTFLRNKIGTSRNNLMRKTAGLEFSTGFREKYQYNNHMYIVLGYLLEVLRGEESWEHQVQTRIADRLGVVKTIRFQRPAAQYGTIWSGRSPMFPTGSKPIAAAIPTRLTAVPAAVSRSTLMICSSG